MLQQQNKNNTPQINNKFINHLNGFEFENSFDKLLNQ